jgi:hypothetical protein
VLFWQCASRVCPVCIQGVSRVYPAGIHRLSSAHPACIHGAASATSNLTHRCSGCAGVASSVRSRLGCVPMRGAPRALRRAECAYPMRTQCVPQPVSCGRPSNIRWGSRVRLPSQRGYHGCCGWALNCYWTRRWRFPGLGGPRFALRAVPRLR